MSEYSNLRKLIDKDFKTCEDWFNSAQMHHAFRQTLEHTHGKKICYCPTQGHYIIAKTYNDLVEVLDDIDVGYLSDSIGDGYIELSEDCHWEDIIDYYATAELIKTLTEVANARKLPRHNEDEEALSLAERIGLDEELCDALQSGYRSADEAGAYDFVYQRIIDHLEHMHEGSCVMPSQGGQFERRVSVSALHENMQHQFEYYSCQNNPLSESEALDTALEEVLHESGDNPIPERSMDLAHRDIDVSVLLDYVKERLSELS